MKITYFIDKGCSPSGITGLIDALTIANLWQQKLSGNPQQLFTAEFISLDGKPVALGKTIHFTADKPVHETIDPEYIIIPPFLPLRDWDQDTIAQLTTWLLTQYQAGIPIAALCTGSFLLAETGLLNGRRATTHWQFTRKFRRRFPLVRLNADEIMVEDDGLITTGATTAYLNFAINLIEQYGTKELSRICGKTLLIDANRTSQAPYSLEFGRRGHKDMEILQAQNFMEENFGTIPTIDTVADHVGISHRHFKRRFKQATGISPLAYLQNLRIDIAKQRLESTGDSIDDITRFIGYEDAGTFRRLFKQRVSLSPREYRDKFARR